MLRRGEQLSCKSRSLPPASRTPTSPTRSYPPAFNIAIFGAGVLDALILPVVMATLELLVLLLTIYGRATAFTGTG